MTGDNDSEELTCAKWHESKEDVVRYCSITELTPSLDEDKDKD